MTRSPGLIAALVLLGACYQTPRPSCTFSCGPGGACPDGYACSSDAICHRQLASGALAACDPPIPDAAPDGPADAMSDAAPDAMPDAAPDAMPDAAPDAMPDAAPDAM